MPASCRRRRRIRGPGRFSLVFGRKCFTLTRHLQGWEEIPLGPEPHRRPAPAVFSFVAAGYAPSTVRKAYEAFARILDRAVDRYLIPRNPCHSIELPRLERHEMRFLAPAEIEQLCAEINERYRALVLTAAYTGLRFGELAALGIDRVDVLRRRLRVEETLNEVQGRIIVGPPKTAAARRMVSLPAFVADQVARHLAVFGAGSDGLVFTSAEQLPIRRGVFRSRVWVPAVQGTVGQPCRFHDLRHSHAALLIAEGVHPKVLQARLGHASIRTTLDIYGHLFDGLDEAAADTLDALRARAISTTDGAETGQIDSVVTGIGRAKP